MNSAKIDGFLSDGYDRARDANEAAIRAAVEQQYADRLKRAGSLERQQLWDEIEREVMKRLTHVAPPWGLYCSMQ